jgi:hypothetical protein
MRWLLLMFITCDFGMELTRYLWLNWRSEAMRWDVNNAFADHRNLAKYYGQRFHSVRRYGPLSLSWWISSLEETGEFMKPDRRYPQMDRPNKIFLFLFFFFLIFLSIFRFIFWFQIFFLALWFSSYLFVYFSFKLYFSIYFVMFNLFISATTANTWIIFVKYQHECHLYETDEV